MVKLSRTCFSESWSKSLQRCFTRAPCGICIWESGTNAHKALMFIDSLRRCRKPSGWNQFWTDRQSFCSGTRLSSFFECSATNDWYDFAAGAGIAEFVADFRSPTKRLRHSQRPLTQRASVDLVDEGSIRRRPQPPAKY